MSSAYFVLVTAYLPLIAVTVHKRTITTDFLNTLADGMRVRIRDLLETEKLVQTLHDEQYSKHYLYYLAALKEGRDSPGATAAREDDSDSGTPRQSMFGRLSRHGSVADLTEGISIALNALSEDGLAKQFPSHESDPALNIMAAVSAYFQGACCIRVASRSIPSDHHEGSHLRAFRGQHPKWDRLPFRVRPLS